MSRISESTPENPKESKAEETPQALKETLEQIKESNIESTILTDSSMQKVKPAGFGEDTISS